MLTDFVTVEKPKESMKIYEQRAADDAADLSGPVESLVQISEGAAAEWGGRRRRGSPDPGEEQKREGWQLRYHDMAWTMVWGNHGRGYPWHMAHGTG